MKITYNKPKKESDISKYRKEKGFASQLTLVVPVIINPNDNLILELAKVRFYYTDTRCYCCLWVRNGDLTYSGGGFAGGYGFHRPSAAFELALEAAGFILSEAIGGRGEAAIETALHSLARYCGFEKWQIIRANA